MEHSRISSHSDESKQDEVEEKEDVLPIGKLMHDKGFEVLERIGEGAYGTVYSCQEKKTGKVVAVKRIEGALDRASACKRTLRELKLLSLLKHENIISLRHVVADQVRDIKQSSSQQTAGASETNQEAKEKSTDIYCVFDLMETDLTTIIKSPQHLSNEHCQFFIYQVLRGLLYIHSAGVIHRDLKPRNVLVNSNCDLRICDFGLARIDTPATQDCQHMTDYVATRWYRAPEIIVASGMYGKSIDMFSAGCILAELLLRKPIFPGADQYDMLKRIAEVLGAPPEHMVRSAKSARMHSFLRNLCFQYPRPLYPLKNLFRGCSSKAVDLISKLITWDPVQRLSVQDALCHPYLATLYCPEDEPTCKSIASEFAYELHQMTIPGFKRLVQQELDHYAEINQDEAFRLVPRQHEPDQPQLSEKDWEEEEKKTENVISRLQRIKLAAKNAFTGSAKKTSPKAIKSPVGSKNFSFGSTAITSQSNQRESERSEL